MANQSSIKTQVYAWQARTKRGVVMRGQLVAASVGIAMSELRRQGLEDISIRQRSKLIASLTQEKIKSIDIILFCRNLTTMIDAGLSIVQAMDVIVTGIDNRAMQALVMAIKADIVGGKTIAESLANHPQYFDDLFCGLVHAGEQSGTLTLMFDRIASYLERTYYLKKKVGKAMMYPFIVLFVAISLTVVLLIFIVPKFQTMFENFGAKLPMFTQLIIDSSAFLQSYWWVIAGIIALTVWGFKKARQQSKSFARRVDQLLLKIGIFGPLIQKIIIARFARTLSTTLASGMPILDAMHAVGRVVGNTLYKEAVWQMREDIAAGQLLHAALAKTQLFPNMVVQMVSVGQESGTLDNMLAKISNFYEEEIDTTINGLSTLLEPIVMVLIAVIIGGFIAAMYLPIFRLGTVI